MVLSSSRRKGSTSHCRSSVSNKACTSIGEWHADASLLLDMVSMASAYEEAIGFMVSPAIRDKDGVSVPIVMVFTAERNPDFNPSDLHAPVLFTQISALAVFASLASWLYSSGQNLSSYLASLYDTYGHFVTLNSYWICRDPVKIAKIFDTLRTSGPSGSYPSRLAEWEIATLKDITKGYDSSASTNDYRLTSLPTDASGQMLSFSLTPARDEVDTDGVHGLIGTIRTSGTEPKIKYYLEGWGTDREDVGRALQGLRDAIAREWMKVEEEGLEAPA